MNTMSAVDVAGLPADIFLTNLTDITISTGSSIGINNSSSIDTIIGTGTSTDAYINMNISAQAVGAFFFVFLGHISLSLFLQWYFYYSSSATVSRWKIQEEKRTFVGFLYGFPAFFTSKPQRAPYYKLFTFINLCSGASFAAMTAEMSVRGTNRMCFDDIHTYGGLGYIAFDFMVAIVWQSVLEYYVHVLMHTKILYSTIHKYHHHYKSPEVWDDLYVHPFEALTHYTVLFSVPVLFRCHIYAFTMHLLVMGSAGILDHCGIKLSIPYIYNTEDHDAHHTKFNVNYAFPFRFMDVLHGTNYKP
jgi:sterol desaturase/sphingolipid hydroxylase (fatty acid hydroxylase superfamily)